MVSTPTAFPSLLIRAGGLSAQGSFAEAQAEYLDPDPASVTELDRLLSSRRAAVVAHFYMDAELQGVLYASRSGRVHISDSLMMADAAVAMAGDGARQIVVLGVDFMSENVRAILDHAGLEQTGCWRVSAQSIGCSLAESAETRAYQAWLDAAARTPKSLHVVYINTSLRTKALAQRKVPTITCTSSNVVATVLQTFAQEPEAQLWFGPDTYMGHNLAAFFGALAQLDEDAIKALHPAHTPATIRALVPRFHVFEQGHCVVHHMFGAEVAAGVEHAYESDPTLDIAAHLEVPGEMFRLALRAQREGRGVIGSTKNILDHVRARVDKALEEGRARRIKVVLGTEAGMVTAIVRALRERLATRPELDIEVEIIFPVAAGAIAATPDPSLPIVPGVAGGEGCTVAGGCATCPYMKINSLDALLDLLERLPEAGSPADSPALAAYEPRKYNERIAGRPLAELGAEPIVHMRAFQATGRLPESLIREVRAR